MPFGNRGLPATTSAPAPAPAAAFGGPPAPPAPAGSPPPPPPAPAAASTLKVWVSLNGQSVLKTEAEARALPATTPAMAENQQGGWLTLAALLPVTTNAPAGRASFGAPPPQHQQAPIQQSTPANLFAGVEGADVIRRGTYLEPGNYVAKLTEAKFQQGRTKSYVIVEVEILTSTYDLAKPDTLKCNTEGSRATIFIHQNDNFKSNIKEIVLAVSGFDAQGKARDTDDTVTQDECNALIGPAQHFTGATVYLEAREVDTKSGGKYTRTSWWPCPLKADGTPDEEKLMREVR